MYGGGGVGWVGRYLWCFPYTEESKLNLSCVYGIL